MFDGFGIEPSQMSCLNRAIKGWLMPARLPPGKICMAENRKCYCAISGFAEMAERPCN